MTGEQAALFDHDPHPPSRKSLIAWPGGKWYFRKVIRPLLPFRVREFVSPFLGGGHMELMLASEGARAHCYDIYRPLVLVWQRLLGDPVRFADQVKAACGGYPMDADTAKKAIMLWHALTPTSTDDDIAVALFLSIHLGFGSMIGRKTPHGFIHRGQHAFVPNRITDRRMRRFRAPTMSVGLLDYRDALRQHPGMFAYLDPPYRIESVLYGERGNVHAAFDHDEFAAVLMARPGPWACSYNDVPAVRDAFRGCRFVDVSARYSIRYHRKGEGIGEGNELLILRP